ncbi:MAG TPA: DinB family protein [Acidimicrobiales bacterium]|nr:DinB family protein [Acidimicrobiales bacterium]
MEEAASLFPVCVLCGDMVETKRELVDLSDEVWRRTRARVEGLSDEEYFWEPVSGCWTIRQHGDGTWVADWPLPRPEPEPFTTIAWRLWHLIDMYGEDRAPRWLDVPSQGEPIGHDDRAGAPPATAADGAVLLERAHERWAAHLALATEERLGERIGPVAGPRYADRTRAAYVLHMLDEFIHHGAEIALLRDLWRWQRSTVADDPRVERVIRGDPSVLDEMGDENLTSDLVDDAASYGRWDLVVGLVQRGAPIRGTGRTPLHVAAGAGELDVVKTLLDHGADPTVTDPEFHATPQRWAEFLQHQAVAEYLAEFPEG